MGFSQSYTSLILIVNAASILMGVSLFVVGILRLKKYGEMRNFMSQQMSIWGPLMVIISATLLLFLPAAIKTASLGFWGTTNPLRYSSGNNSFLHNVILFVRLFGLCSFIRGVFLLARTGQEHSQPGTLSKAMIHMISGLLCLYVEPTIGILQTLLGLPFKF